MKLRLAAPILLIAAVCLPALAEQTTPRDIWPQATAAAREGDLDSAIKKTGEMVETGRAYGIKRYPVYAAASAAYAGESHAEGKKEAEAWATKTATQLDSRTPSVSFTFADFASAQGNWGRAIPAALRGFGQVFTNFRSSILSRADLLIVLCLALALTSVVFAVSLFIRYGRSMAHDFRETLSTRFHGGSVSVLAFALLFLPIFLWLGPMWLVFYWLVIFFGYASVRERVFIVIIALLMAALPIMVDAAASWVAIVDSPVVMSAISSAEQSYQPEALRRLQELVSIAPDNSTLQVLLGNMLVFEGNDIQAAEHYRRAIQLNDSAGAHINLGNLHFLQNDYGAAITEYQRAQKKDPSLAIAFYNNSIASGEMYRFDEQGKMLEQAKKVDQQQIEQLSQNPPAQKIAMYHPRIGDAWRVASTIAEKGSARSLFANYAYFDPISSGLNPVTLGALAAILFGVALWSIRKKNGFAGSCIKCGRTFCHRCKSARESATYCTQCIHIYLKRDGVALATKRAKLDEVSDFHAGVQKRNRLFATFLPGSAQLLEGRTPIGLGGMLLFFFFVATAVLVGRLGPALGPVADTAQLIVRVLAIVLAVIMWLTLSLPVYRRRATTVV